MMALDLAFLHFGACFPTLSQMHTEQLGSWCPSQALTHRARVSFDRLDVVPMCRVIGLGLPLETERARPGMSLVYFPLLLR